MPVLARRIRLLRALRAARPPLVAALCVVNVLNALIPAATAVATAVLVSRISGHAPSGLLAATVGPLLLLAAVMVAGHAAEAGTVPLEFLAKARIDGAHRAALARLASFGPTVDRLERPRVQQLVRIARADPQNWTERTPGDGALGQVRWFAGLIGAVASCAVLARYAWWLVPALLVPAALNRFLGNRVHERFVVAWRAGIPEGMHSAAWADALVSTGEGKDIRLFGLEEWSVAKIGRHLRGLLGPAWELASRIWPADLRRFLLIVVPLAAVYAAVADGTAHGHATVAVETAVLASGWSLFQAFGLSEDARNMAAALEGLNAFDEVAAELRPDRPAPSQEADTAAEPEPAARAPLVRFEDVCFTYPGTTRRVIDHLDLEIRPNELLAIVGLNGAGKSTLIKLLSGLYEPDSGRVTADGVDLRRLGARRWRRHISVVFQDFVRYHLSVAQNVALGRGDVPFDRGALEAAARDAGLAEVLDRLPDGWDTPLSRARTGGVDLSGGQWQQVVLARALYAVRTGAGLLVLDEPTAHLDVRTEFEVFDRLSARREQAGVVLISHRLSTVRQADRIVLLEHGRITESGTHDELVAAEGTYAEMFAIQAERFQRGYDDVTDDATGDTTADTIDDTTGDATNDLTEQETAHG
ncbi:ABC transporter ATP-binding protein [Catenulispora rubra]|uniref:ABC transporter ATP-binding protein n=1 Tax=Catenulispora rubra TaxID=280293 RepID=UPI0018921470|nr:ABC transporter ATP-binding protein [Catenulispora rubra]